MLLRSDPRITSEMTSDTSALTLESAAPGDHGYTGPDRPQHKASASTRPSPLRASLEALSRRRCLRQ
jgi:hypothetical protein